MEHEAGEGDEAEACDGFGQSLVVADEVPEAGSPSEGALDGVAPGQEAGAVLGFLGFDRLALDTVLGGGLGQVGRNQRPTFVGGAGRTGSVGHTYEAAALASVRKGL